jgi:8-oxo-dGTP pyrophosphatase MutT (NUDIX family)
MDFRTKLDKQTFGVRATALIIKNNKICLSKRSDGYHTIGGAVEVNETSSQAAIRETKEELGIDAAVTHLAFVVENYFTVKDVNYHNIEFHYILNPLQEIPPFMLEGDNQYPCEWIALDKLEDFEIKPSFLKTALKNWDGQIKHFVNKDGEE